MLSAPLQVTVEIELLDGPAAGQRRFRLSSRVEIPPALRFDRELPVEGEARGRVRFAVPEGPAIVADALMRCDPEHPEQGSAAELVNVEAPVLQALRAYIEERMTL